MHHQPWLATYRNNGIPAGINADAYPSVVHLMEAAMTRYADKPAFRAFGQTLSYADVDRQSGAFAAWLQNKLGVKKGDRIAVMAPNLLAFPIAMLGIVRAGAGRGRGQQALPAGRVLHRGQGVPYPAGPRLRG